MLHLPLPAAQATTIPLPATGALVPRLAPADGAQQDPGNPWISWQYLRDNSGSILAALREHLELTAQAVVVAAVVGVLLAVLAYLIRPLTGPILAGAGVLYTMPALAVFAFIAPYLGTGTRTVVIPLVLYALLMITRNALTGLVQVPEEVRDAARGMGYGRLARLLRIELPLALPGILTGLRLATVSTVALTTVGALIGHGGLGELIMSGFRNNLYRAQILTGAVLCVALALVLDLVLLSLGRLATPWVARRRSPA